MTEQNVNQASETEGRVVPQSALFSNHIQFKVILADDTSYDGQAYLNSTNRCLNVRILESAHASMVELFQAFSNPEKTAVIKSQTVDTEEPETFSGYTVLIGIRTDPSGNTSITLDKPTE